MMYKIGDYVVYGSKGICVINDITTVDMNEVDNKKLYYILTPVNSNNGRLFVPVEGEKTRIRNLMTREEAKNLIDNLPEIREINITNDKFLEAKYREMIKEGLPYRYIEIIKTIYMRKQRRTVQGKKLTEVDGRYFKKAEELLFSELSFVLSIPVDNVEKHITECLEDNQLVY